jgi:hypothetical protein
MDVVPAAFPDVLRIGKATPVIDGDDHRKTTPVADIPKLLALELLISDHDNPNILGDPQTSYHDHGEILLSLVALPVLFAKGFGSIRHSGKGNSSTFLGHQEPLDEGEGLRALPFYVHLLLPVLESIGNLGKPSAPGTRSIDGKNPGSPVAICPRSASFDNGFMGFPVKIARIEFPAAKHPGDRSSIAPRCCDRSSQRRLSAFSSYQQNRGQERRNYGLLGLGQQARKKLRKSLQRRGNSDDHSIGSLLRVDGRNLFAYPSIGKTRQGAVTIFETSFSLPA